MSKRTLTLRKGYAAIIPPDKSFMMANRGKKMWESRWLTFDGPAAEMLCRFFHFPEHPFPAKEFPLSDVNRMTALLADPSLNGERQAGVELYGFLAKMAILAAGEEFPDDEQDSTTLIQKISQKTMLGGNVQEIAAELGCSRSTVRRIFRKQKGMPPKNYADSLRLQKSVFLLQNSELSVATIARETGFDNANYFTKFFKKKTGKTPTIFRSEKFMP